MATPLQTCDDADCPSMTDKLFQYILFIHFLMNLYIIGIIVMNGAGIVAAATAAILIDVIEWIFLSGFEIKWTLHTDNERRIYME